MKYCYQCNHITPGEPLFCNFCGRTYNVKLCQRLHANSRNAQVCSQCGSREFSTPQPKLSFWTKVLVVAVTVALGIALLYFSLLLVIIFLTHLLSQPDVQTALLGLGILIGLLWWMWFQLPHWMRKRIHRLLEGQSKKRRGE
jgi:cytochrome c biogenesis protein CcdA